MLRYKAGFKYVESGVHVQVLDFPAAITCAGDLASARRLLGIALVDVAEAAVESGRALPVPDPAAYDPEMDIEEPIYLHLRASAGVREVPTGAVSSKRQDLIRHLRSHGCQLLREGKGHSVWANPTSGRQSAVPRHREVDDYTARAICRQLGIPEP